MILKNNAAGGGKDLDGREIYTLSFDGAPAQQGYHVKVESTTLGASKSSDGKSKTFSVGPCTTGGGTTDPGTGGGTTDPGTGGGTTDPGTGGGTTDPGTGAAPPTPAHHAVRLELAVRRSDLHRDDGTYPSNLPSGQANDANIRFRTASGEFTLNFHNNTGTWSGTHAFTYADHPNWPAGLTSYDVVWVQIAGTDYHWQGSVECRPVVVVPPIEVPPFDWNWEYPTPTCTALNVVYPSNIPSGQANDANIRFESNVGQFTLNFHNNTGTWSGAHSFSYTDHPNWPAGVTSYRVVWTQVGGTNYHWQGNVVCGADSTPPTTGPTTGPRCRSDAVARGPRFRHRRRHGPQGQLPRDAHGPGPRRLRPRARAAQARVVVQVSHVSTDGRGVARVVFPRLAKRGNYSFRLSVPSSHDAAGTCTGVLRVRVR